MEEARRVEEAKKEEEEKKEAKAKEDAWRKLEEEADMLISGASEVISE